MRRVVLIRLALLLSAFHAELLRAAQVESGQAVQEVRLDFEDAELRAVVSALAELMGANVIYGALPSRTVTLKTNTPVPRDSLRPIFLSLLQANELAAVEEAGVLRVIAAPEAMRRTGPSAPPEGELRLFVIRLKHAHASEVASLLSALFGRALAEVSARPVLGGVRLSEQLRETLVQPGLPREELRGEPEGGGVARSGEFARGLQAEVRGEVTIVPDISTNSLLIRAVPADFEVIREAVEHLDVRPLQVMIEVLIAEMRRDALTKLGLEILLPEQGLEGVRGLRVQGELHERVLGNLVIQIMQLDGARIEALFEALSTSSDVTILSRPVIVTANNQEAHILVGSERPFVQVARALPTEAPVRDQIIQFRDVGTKLSIVPTINYDGYVRLSVVQEVSQATAETQFGAPVISTREAATQLLVKSGQTVVIGGLVDQQREHVRSGIPLLKDLPFVGALFGSSSWRKVETELFLFLTPHVLESDADADRVRESVEETAPRIRERLPEPLIPRDTTHAGTTGASKAPRPRRGTDL
ncbi:MAG: hypothetical protein AMS25_11470 [Gemmatimonas sp. SM23_52]|nr:MAG: hypothetical protein AMS25_11470 [Gemmatimonas sp. SM23_52]